MKNLHKLLATIILAILYGANSYAQVPGTLDSSFAINGKQILKPSNGFENANELVILPDDRIVGVGFTTGPLGDWDVAVFRLLADGTVDSTFGVNGLSIFDIAGNYDYGNAIYRLGDGKLLIAGGATLPNWYDIDLFVARLNEDGSMDASFGTDGISQVHTDGSEDLFYSMAIQPDGKILAAGQDERGGTTLLDGIIMRFEADGKVDSTFGTNGIVKTDIEYDYSIFRDLLLNEDGSIIAAGNCANDKYDILLAKYDSDGQPDATFGNNGIKVHNLNTGTDDAFTILRHSIDGRILVGGRIGHGNSKTDMLLMAIDESGAIDSTFATNGLAVLDAKAMETFTDMTIQPNGKIVMCGTSGGTGLGDNDWLVARFNEDGTIDSSFGESGGYTITEAGSFFSEADGIALQSTGRIITVGIAANDNNDMGILAYYGDDIATSVVDAESNTGTSLKCYPNPSNGDFILTLHAGTTAQSTAQVQIFNQIGQVIYNEEVKMNGEMLNKQFYRNDFEASGIYFVKATIGNTHYSGKMLIQQ